MGTLSEQATPLFSLLLGFSIGVKLLKERICSLRSKFFSFKSRPDFGRAVPSGEAIGNSQKLFPFVDLVKNPEGILVHLNSP